MLIKLIYNFSTLIALSALSGVIDQFVPRRTIMGKMLQGLLFGGTAVVGMLYPFVMAEGLIFDGRSIVISLATLFFGPLTGAISASIASAYRFYIGGAGVYMGIGVIISSFIIGWAFHHLRILRKSARLRFIKLLIFGFTVHLVMFALIVLLPTEHRAATFEKMGIIILGLYPFITLLMGIILNDQEQNQRMFVELSKSEKFLKTVFQSIGDALISLDRKGHILGVNQAGEKLIGLEEKSLIKSNIDHIVSLIKEPFSLISLLSDNKDYDFIPSVEISLPDEKKLTVSLSISKVVDADNKHRGWILSIRDLSGEREYQSQIKAWDESYKGLFNSFLSPVYIQNERGEFLDVNKSAASIYGYPLEAFIGKTPEFLAAPGLNNLDELALHIKKAYNGDSVRFEFWGKKASGEIFPKEVFLFPTNYRGQKAILAIANDISERKSAEKHLRLSEARYKTLFDSSPLGMILEDLDGTILEVNKSFCTEFGYEPEELIGKNIRMLAGNEFQNEVSKNIDHIIRHGHLNTIVKSYTKTGEELIVELHESLIDLPDGRKGILSIDKNITAQVLAEKAREESEQKTQAIIRALPDMIFVLSNEGIFIDCLACDDKPLLVKPEEFIGHHVNEVLPSFLAGLTLEKMQLTRQTGKVTEYEYDLMLEETLESFEARMVILNEAQILVLVRRITERKKTELAIKQQNVFIESLLDSIPNPIFYINKNSVYLGVNKAFTEFFGIKREDIVGKSMFEWDIKCVAERNYKDDLPILEGKEKVQQRERRLKIGDGIERDVLLIKSAFHTADGEVAGLIGLIIDITERKKHEQELRKAKEKAEESDRLKTSFLHNLNHEIRTPLNAIMGFADLLNDDLTEENKKEFTQIINSNAEQLLRIIDDVLIVSRLDAEKLPVDKADFDLGQLIRDLQLTFANACAEKNLRFVIDTPFDAFPRISTDKAKLRQALSGLIDNAVKYTPKGEIGIGFHVDGDDLLVHVRDTGLGIPYEEQDKIFERFFRGQEVQKMAIRGNGLGLSIVHGLVELLNGSISLVSQPGLGTTFTLKLPGVVIARGDAGNREKQVMVPQTNKKFRVLIAEDEDDNFEYLKALLAGMVSSTDRARTGSEALQLIDRTAYDLILMDIKMPEMDGIEATRLIHIKYPKLPIVVQTAFSQPEELKKVILAGARDVLIKPINREEFYNLITRLLN